MLLRTASESKYGILRGFFCTCLILSNSFDAVSGVVTSRNSNGCTMYLLRGRLTIYTPRHTMWYEGHFQDQILVYQRLRATRTSGSPSSSQFVRFGFTTYSFPRNVLYSAPKECVKVNE